MLLKPAIVKVYFKVISLSNLSLWNRKRPYVEQIIVLNLIGTILDQPKSVSNSNLVYNIHGQNLTPFLTLERGSF